MPRSNPLWSSFNTGEVSKRLHARTDFEKYKSSVALLENMIPLAEGPVQRRAGFRYVAEEKSSAVKGRLKRFQFSTEQAYVVEMADGAVRFFRHQGQIVADPISASIANGDFTTNIANWTDRSAGGTSAISHSGTSLSVSSDGTNEANAEQIVTIGAAFTAVTHVVRFRVIGIPGDIVYLRIGTSSTGRQVVDDVPCRTGYHCHEFVPGAATVYLQFVVKAAKAVLVDDVALLNDEPIEITSPYVEADLYEIEGPQSADVLYMYHPEYKTRRLERRGHRSWSLVEVLWEDGPWLDMNATATTLTPSATTGVATITASSVNGINGGLGFQSTDRGRLIRIDNPASGVNWGWALIGSVTNTTTVIADVFRAFGSTNADTRWMLGAWSDTTGWPTGGAFHEQRLISFHNAEQPQTIWASNTGDFEVMSPDSPDATSGAWDGEVQDDDSFAYTISADDVNSILWASPGDNTLVLGTAGGEWVPESQGAVLTPTDIAIRRRTSTPAARVQPIRVDNVVLFVQRAKRKIREFAYALESDGYRALDMTRLAQHITSSGIVEMDLAEEPDSLVWAVRTDGTLLSMTYRREENVVGWARHPIGGSFNGDPPVVESVVVIPGADGAGQVQSSESRDEVWIIVKRTINGATKRYIEVLERDWNGDDGHDQADAYYADSIITYDGAAATVITGLDHLEGQTVKVFGDGAVLPDAVVSGGSITLDSEKSTVQIGLGYAHKLQTLKAMAGTAAGTPMVKKKRYSGMGFVVLNSHTLSVGPDADHLHSFDFRQVSDAMDAAAPFFSGERFDEFDCDWLRDPRVYLQSSDPVPFVLMAIAPEVNVTEMK